MGSASRAAASSVGRAGGSTADHHHLRAALVVPERGHEVGVWVSPVAPVEALEAAARVVENRSEARKAGQEGLLGRSSLVAAAVYILGPHPPLGLSFSSRAFLTRGFHEVAPNLSREEVSAVNEKGESGIRWERVIGGGGKGEDRERGEGERGEQRRQMQGEREREREREGGGGRAR